MGIYSWHPVGGLSFVEPIRTPRLTVGCEYPETFLEPTGVTFGLSPSYSLLTGPHDEGIGDEPD